MGRVAECEQEEPLALPVSITLSRGSFEAHVRGHSFQCWEELVRALPGGMAPQGASLTSVKVDPLQIFAMVATLLMQIGMWGMVAYFTWQNLVAGIVLTSAYGVALWLCIDRLAPQMAGVLWPNLPTIVGAVGLQVSIAQGGFEHFPPSPLKLFCFTIVPASAAAVFFMRKLPEDPYRAVLVTNLFVGIWSGNLALVASLGPGEAFVWRWSAGSLLACGAAAIGAAVALSRSPRKWSSVELVTWTLCVGCSAVTVALPHLLFLGLPDDYDPVYDLFGWVVVSTVSALFAVLGLRLGRTLPVLLSALGLFAVCVRLSTAAAAHAGDSATAGFCTFGGLGLLTVVLAQRLLTGSNVLTSAQDKLL
ncbi:unnamed protein product [Prorocentrum cordatum]|uniref:DUF2157 domain-containing protein n=1 Tax=Prorocentrum cordatum TaxID=2364126 RepID=A0ABN9UHM3_9DINO|nr:unnamed protein product [Polarella glacialis]